MLSLLAVLVDLLTLLTLPRAALGLLVGLAIGFALCDSSWAIGACGLACLFAGWHWERYDQQNK